jgi:hypothetical protein
MTSLRSMVGSRDSVVGIVAVRFGVRISSSNNRFSSSSIVQTDCGDLIAFYPLDTEVLFSGVNRLTTI